MVVDADWACLNVEPLSRIRYVEVQVGGCDPGFGKKIVAHDATPRSQNLGSVLGPLPAALRADVVHIENLADAWHQLIADSTVEFVPCVYEGLPQRSKPRISLFRFVLSPMNGEPIMLYLNYAAPAGIGQPQPKVGRFIVLSIERTRF